MNNEEEIALLKRVIVYITRPVNQMSNQAKEDVELLEQKISELGGDTRNDLRALKMPEDGAGYEFGDDPEYTGEG